MKEKFRPVLSVRIFADAKCFGPGVAELLHRVQELNSLRAASMSMGMAYSKAWTIIKNAEKSLGFPLLQSTTGGKHGGGATLSSEAKKLLPAYDGYCASLRKFAEDEFVHAFESILK